MSPSGQVPSESVHKELRKLESLAASPQETVLMQFSSIFPFDLFPTTVTIDRNKVTIKDRFFFWSQQTHSVAVKDLMSAMVETSLFFASLHIVDRLYPGDTISIPFLSIKQADRARRILNGLIVASKEGIDLDIVPRNELLPKLLQIGSAQSPAG